MKKPMDKLPEFGVFKAIQFSKNQLEAIFDHLEPMCVVAQDFTIVRLNKSMAEFLASDYQNFELHVWAQ